MDFDAQTYRDDAAQYGDEENHAPMGVYGVLSAIWFWLGMISREVLGRYQYRGHNPQRRNVSPANRELRMRIARFNRRPVPPARNHAVLRQLYGRGISRTQFLERLCRRSVDGRIRVYYMVYWSSRMTREAFMAIFTRGAFRAPDGLCDAHIPPD